jgi:hypothetical protein
MVKVRTAKNKGNSYEYDCLESIQQVFPDAYLTKQRGFVQQVDILDDEEGISFECKRHASFSWNEINLYWRKLKRNSPEGYICYVLVQQNRNPCLVFDGIQLTEFKSKFGVEFKKHTPIKKNAQALL